MKFCFIQKQAFPYFGVMSLAGSLAEAGIACDVIITNLEDDFIATLTAIRPDLIGFSVLTTEHEWLSQTSAAIKTIFPATPIIVGGIHAMLYPELILQLPSVDFVCSGEGEETLRQLCHALDTGGDFEGLQGIGYKQGEQIILNQRHELLPELGGYREDRSVYYGRYDVLRCDELKQFIASRGCPYGCSFCFNERLHALFPKQKKRVRMKPPQQLIEEIEAVRAIAPLRSIFFSDDLFAANREWLREFGELYCQRIKIPYMCITRADRMDQEIAELLKASGCHTVSFGIESGNERLRSTVLNKSISNQQIIRCATLLHQQGIRVQTSNMFCLPDETLDDAFSTVRLNISIKADFIFTPLFMPFPGTRLADYCREKGYLPPDFGFKHLPQSFLTHSILNHPDRQRIENLQRIAYFLVRQPALFGPAKVLIRNVTCAWLYYPFLFLATLLRYQAERGLSLYGTVRFLWRFRKSF